MTRCCPSSQKAEVFFSFSLDWGCKLFSQPLQRSNNRPPVPREHRGGSAWRERGIRHAARTRGRLVGKRTQREMTEKSEREKEDEGCAFWKVFSASRQGSSLCESGDEARRTSAHAKCKKGAVAKADMSFIGMGGWGTASSNKPSSIFQPNHKASWCRAGPRQHAFRRQLPFIGLLRRYTTQRLWSGQSQSEALWRFVGRWREAISSRVYTHSFFPIHSKTRNSKTDFLPSGATSVVFFFCCCSLWTFTVFSCFVLLPSCQVFCWKTTSCRKRSTDEAHMRGGDNPEQDPFWNNDWHKLTFLFQNVQRSNWPINMKHF